MKTTEQIEFTNQAPGRELDVVMLEISNQTFTADVK